MGRVLHFDCFSGISGDMALAALLDLGVPHSEVQAAVGSLGLPGTLHIRRVDKNGFDAVKIDVEAPNEHAHRHLPQIREILQRGNLSDSARSLALRMFEKLAEAEATVHGIEIEKVHFHEVGAVDSIFDFVGVAVGIDWLGPVRITSSAVPTGSGWVRCEHGTLPVPAPAVALLLKGIPLAPARVEGELTTPTGAAILATLVEEFVSQPILTIEKVGLGAGSRDYADQPNLLRMFLGEESTTAGPSTDQIWQVETNLDDVAPEILGYCFERLFEEGALDVFSQPIQMKKNRPGVLLSVLCRDADLSRMERIIFQETGTFGVRRQRVERTKLQRRAVEVTTPWGTIQGKLGWDGQTRILAPEFEDCARVARERGLPLRTIYEETVRRLAEEFGSADARQK